MSRLQKINAYIAIVFCMTLLLGLSSTAYAQSMIGGGNTFEGERFPVNGASALLVDISGGHYQRSFNRCPFEPQTQTNIDYWAAATSAANGSDPDSCPYANGNNGEKIYLSHCAAFYDRQAQRSGTATPDSSRDMAIACCHLPPDIRSACKFMGHIAVDQDKAEKAEIAIATNTIPSESGILSPEQIEQQKQKQEKQKQAWQQCFSGSKDRITQYWAKKRSVQCIKSATRLIKQKLKRRITEIADNVNADVTVGLSATGTAGIATAVAPVPSPYGLMAIVKTLTKMGINLSASAVETAVELATLLEDCASILPGLQELNEWKNSTLNNLCRQAESLVERQLTQCIRVNFRVDLTLPQFSVLLQCPININIDGQLSAQGFNFNCNTMSSNTISTNFGGDSFFAAMNGGLENLFNGKCFRGNAGSNGGSAGSVMTTGRVPGIDCGPLNTSDVLRQEVIQGVLVLAPGRVTDGWVAGRTETAASPPNGNGAIQITRCDYYESNKLLRTAYVYGRGASCNSSATGFTQGSFETNVACYPGGYNPAVAPQGITAPDACMYPVACLDSVGKFSNARVGTGACPVSTVPTFNAAATYIAFTSGGIGGGTPVVKECAEFATMFEPTITCCDPQKQDCLAKDANTPYCACDEGDETNRIVGGVCEKGGNPTCCSPRLNGGPAGCDIIRTNGGPQAICADEVDQCIAGDGAGTVTYPNGSTTTTTAKALAGAKPSPYQYLFLSPDASVVGKQCCTTEWCNICPQHYANAYGLSLAGAQIAPPTGNNSNNNLLGRGWPFRMTTDDFGVSIYELLGARRFEVPRIRDKFFGPQVDGDPMPVQYPRLFMSDTLTMKPTADALASCNSINPRWVASYASMIQFGDSNADMGYVYDSIYGKGKKEDRWVVVGPVPSMTESPLDYMNKQRSNFTYTQEEPMELIELCSNVAKFCTPTQEQDGVGINSGLTRSDTRRAIDARRGIIRPGGALDPSIKLDAVPRRDTTGSGARPAAVYGTTTTVVPSASTMSSSPAPVARTPATPTTTPSAGSTTQNGATAVPSLGGSGQAPGSLY